MASEILRYGAALNQNRLQFLLNYKVEFESFEALDKLFPRFAARRGRATRLRTGWPRSSRSCSARRATPSRASPPANRPSPGPAPPGHRGPLIMGKWLDDPQNAVVWLSRNSGKIARKEYQDAYSGDRQKPHALPHAEALAASSCAWATTS